MFTPVRPVTTVGSVFVSRNQTGTRSNVLNSGTGTGTRTGTKTRTKMSPVLELELILEPEPEFSNF